MSRARIHGLPVLRFTRRLSPRRWDVTTSIIEDAPPRRWSVTVAPRGDSDNADRVPFATVHVERADGSVEGAWSSDPSSNARWSYSRTVDLQADEAIPSLVLHESLVPRRLAFVRRRLSGNR